MPNWKKLIVSGSDANLNSLDVLASITGSTFLVNNTISIADGTAAAPSLRFTDDPDTGIFRSTDNKFNITVGGTNMLGVDSAGIHSSLNVYSGTSGQFRNYAGVWKATTGTTGNGFNFTSADLSDLLTISSTGDSVFKGDITITDTTGTRGISRNNTGYNLNLMGGTDLTDGAYISLSGETRGGASNSYNGRIEIYSGGGGLTNQAAALGDIIFGTKWNGGSSNILVLDSSTNNATFAGDIDADDITINDWGSVSASLSTLTQNQIDGSGTADYVARFSDANTLTTGIIRDDGSTVGINAAPSANKTLYIDGTLQATGEGFFSHLDIIGTSGNSRIRDDIQFKFGTNRVFGIQYNSSGDYLEFTSGSNNLVSLLGNGRVGIGTTSPAALFDVNGTAQMSTGITENTHYVGASVAHWGDGDTNITFATDRQTFKAGNVEFVDFANTTQDYITVGGTSDIDARLQGGSGYVFVQGSNGYVGINDASPTVPLDISGNTRISGDLDVTGNITAQEFHTEFVSASIIYESGSTKFGDTSDDTHSFTGSIALTGSGITIKDPTTPTLNLIDETNDLSLKFRSANNYGYIDVDQGDSVGSSRLQLRVDGYSFLYGNQNHDVFIPSGSLTIGTESGTGKFNSYISATRQLTHNGNGGDFSILSDNNSNPVFYLKGTGTADLVNIFDNTTEVFTILDGGNVGVGNTSPLATLTVGSGAGSLNSAAELFVPNNDALMRALKIGHGASVATIMTDDSTKPMAFNSGGSERMRISSAGALKFNSYGSGTHTGTLAKSLGVDSSGNVIEFSGGSGGSVSSITNGADNRIATFTGADSLNGEANLTFDGDIFAVNTDELYVSASRVGIGTTSPAVTLHVDGFARLNGGLQLNQNGAAQVYQIQNNALRFGTNNTERMRISADGNVGIGTTSPTKDLVVNSDTGGQIQTQYQGSDKFRMQADSGGGSFYSVSGAYTRFHTSGVERLRITSDGKVGIGTTSPASSLHVYGDGPAIFENAANTDIDVRWRSAGSNKYNAFYQASTDSWGIYHNPASAYRFFITGSNGDIGIGTNTPSSKLHIVGTTSQLFIENSASNGNAYIKFKARSDRDAGPFIKSTARGATSTDSDLRLGDETGDIITLNGGNVGIGTVSPAATLDVHGRVDFANDLRLRGNDSSADQGVVRFFVDSNNKLSIDTVNDGNNLFVIDSSGNVGIGSNTPARKLDVNGEIQNNGIFRRAGNVIIKSTGSETMFGPGGSGIITFHNSATMTTSDETIRIDANGNLLLNNTSAGARLDIREDSNYAIRAEDASGHYFRVNTGGDVDMRGDLTVQGVITAQEFHTEFVSASIVFQSGSTKFGDTLDDNHDFTGSLNVSGSIVVDDLSKLQLGSGASGDFRLFHNGTNSLIANNTGNIEIIQYVNDGDIVFKNDDGSGNTTEYFRVDGGSEMNIFTKKVGIGTTSTSRMLHVVGNTELEGTLFVEAANNNIRLLDTNDATVNFSVGVNGLFQIRDVAAVTSPFQIEKAAPDNSLRIDADGNVGIGTSDPTAPLTVKSNSVSSQSSGITLQASGSTDDIIRMGEKSTNGGRLHMFDGGVEKIAFYTDGTDNHISAGNVGIGTNVPTKTLHVGGEISGSDVYIDDWGSVSASLATITGNDLDGTGTANTIPKWSDSDTLTDSYLTQPSATTLKLSSDGSATAGTILELHFPNNNTTDRCATINFTNNVGGYAAIEGGTTGANNTGYIGFKVDNAGTQSEPMRITGNGNVGIGTTAPAFKTTIYSDSSTDSFPLVVGQPNAANEFVGIGLSGFVASNGAVKAGLVLDRKNTYGVGDIHILNNTTTDNSNATLADSKFTILQNGNIGIGTTSPAGKLDVNGQVILSGDTEHYIEKDTTSLITSATVETTTVSGRNVDLYAYDDINFRAGTTDKITMHAGGSERVRIDSSGNVGIGTTSPSANLHVQNSNSAVLTVDATDGGSAPAMTSRIQLYGYEGRGAGIKIRDSVNSASGASNREWFVGSGYAQSGFNIGYASDGSQSSYAAQAKLAITTGGDVGIGTTSPNAKLHISSSGAAVEFERTGQETYKITHGTSGLYFTRPNSSALAFGVTQNSDFHTFDTSANVLLASDASAGNVGIGDTSPLTKLHVKVTDTTGTKSVYGKTLIEDTDAQLDLLSTSAGSWGSAINFIEAAGSSANTDIWSIARQTTGGTGDSSLRINFGTNNQHDNTNKFKLDTAGNITIPGGITVGDSNADTAQIGLKHLLGYCENTDVDTGTEDVKSLPLATYQAVFFDYVVKNGTNLRAGTIAAVHDGTNVEYTDTSTKDLGDTTAVTLSVDISGTNMRLRATTTSDNWIVKANIRGIKV